MAGHELRERIDYCNDGFREVIVFHAGGTPQRTSARHIAAGSGGLGTINWHGVVCWIAVTK
jgi:hypothetical protein